MMLSLILSEMGCLPFMAQMLQLHSFSWRCAEWRTWKVTFLQWQLPLCITSVFMIGCLISLCGISLSKGLYVLLTIYLTTYLGDLQNTLLYRGHGCGIDVTVASWRQKKRQPNSCSSFRNGLTILI